MKDLCDSHVKVLDTSNEPRHKLVQDEDNSKIVFYFDVD